MAGVTAVCRSGKGVLYVIRCVSCYSGNAVFLCHSHEGVF